MTWHDFDKEIERWANLPEGQVVGLAARVTQVDHVEALGQGHGQLLDVLAEGVREEALCRGQSGQLALSGGDDLKRRGRGWKGRKGPDRRLLLLLRLTWGWQCPTWAVPLMQSRYSTPSESNMYCLLALLIRIWPISTPDFVILNDTGLGLESQRHTDDAIASANLSLYLYLSHPSGIFPKKCSEQGRGFSSLASILPSRPTSSSPKAAETKTRIESEETSQQEITEISQQATLITSWLDRQP